jgi:hypothetical protein
MVVGDLHGDTRAGVTVLKKAKSLGIDTIMQVGDFGYWPHFTDGIDFLDALNFTARENDLHLYWLDGNHENFDALEAAVKHYPKDDHGRVWIRSHIRYCSRGASWTWNHKRFMTVGGAVSVDKANRVWQEQQHGHTRRLWWPQEQLTDDELQFAMAKAAKKPVDYLFTHDCPTNAPFRGRMKNDLDSQAHRQKMDRLGQAVKPKVWFHGHMHTRYDGYDFPTYEPHTTVYGLECNPDAMHGYGSRSWWGVLNTATDKFEYAPAL